MRHDVHVHVAGTDTARHGNYIAPSLLRRPLFRLLALRVGGAWGWARPGGLDDRIRTRLLRDLEASVIDRAVFLAFDAVYRRDGTRDEARTRLVTSNDYVAAIAAGSRKVLFGASIHPYRRDALQELERVLERGACLIKWIPGSQGIAPDDPLCVPFYRALAAAGVPLLSHTGHEHTLPVLDPSLNHPARLRTALDQGVTVIAAHCGAALNRREECLFPVWRAMVRDYDRLYGDLGAFVVPERVRLLRLIGEDPALGERLVYGSDHPALTVPASYLGRVPVRVGLRLLRTRNPFDKPYRILEALGLPGAACERAGRLLRKGAVHADPAAAA